jgi:hypothetical protein
MMIKKSNIASFLVVIMFFVLTLESCKKKLPHYSVSDEMKQYFVFQKGSYWIYRDAYTGSIDSTCVASFYHDDNQIAYSNISREYFQINFESRFLYDFEIAYETCTGPNLLRVTERNDTLFSNNQTETGGNIAYESGWPSKTNIVTPCISNDVLFYYSKFSNDSVNGIDYRNV